MGSSLVIRWPKKDVLDYLHNPANLANWSIWLVDLELRSPDSFMASLKLGNKPIKGEFMIGLIRRALVSARKWTLDR